MKVKQVPDRAKSEIQRTRDTIRRSWSADERAKRRRLAAARQEQLFAVLLAQPAAMSARVA